MTNYGEIRQSIYGIMRDKGVFTWDWLYEEEYALASMVTISKGQRDELHEVSTKLSDIFSKTVKALQNMPLAVLEGLGIKGSLAQCARVDIGYWSATMFGRFDFARTKEGFKLLEYNADTPSGLVEALYVNGLVCDYFGKNNPNKENVDDLQSAFKDILQCYIKQGLDPQSIVFSSLDWHEEDAGTTKFLMSASGFEAAFVPLSELRWINGGLSREIDGKYEKIDLWIRLHPYEVMAEECDEDGYPIGQKVLELIGNNRLAVINPPSAILAQTKALQALIWGLYEKKEFFTEDEMQTIEKYMLPTYLDNNFAGRTDYVRKPILGREGANVELFDKNDNLVVSNEGVYQEQMFVYQKAVELERYETETADGVFDGYLLWGSFAINGKGSAILARLGGRITEDMAYFCPVAME